MPVIALLACISITDAQAPAGKPLTTAQVWTLNATYIDKDHGVSFRYPSTWQPTTQFAYHPPVLTFSQQARPIAGFGYSEGGFPRQSAVGPYSNTNLEGVGIVYSAIPASGAGSCDAMAASISGAKKLATAVFGGHSFSVFETFDGGMSQSISGNLYATSIGQFCYFFETDAAIATAGDAEGIPTLSAAQNHAISRHLLDIMKSVRISPKAASN